MRAPSRDSWRRLPRRDTSTNPPTAATGSAFGSSSSATPLSTASISASSPDPSSNDSWEQVGETATLSVAGGHEAVTVDFVRSPSSVQGVAQLGRPSVAHATATGKVLLAYAGIGLPPGPLRRYTARTIADPRALAREVERVRARGWADAVGEREGDLAGIAAPVRGSRGELAAIVGIQGPTARLDAKARAAALEPLRAAALALSVRLGFVED